MNSETVLDEFFEKTENKKLSDKQKTIWHDKLLKLNLEDVFCVFPNAFKKGILDKLDGQALFEELLARHDRVSLYHLVFDCIAEKANFLSKTQLENLKAEVIEYAPIESAFDLVFFLKNTKFLTRSEIEHIAFRVLSSEHISCYADAFYVFEDLDVFEPEDLELMWQRTMAIGDLDDCIKLADAFENEDVVSKKEVQTLFDECLEEINGFNLKDADEKLEAQDYFELLTRLLSAFENQKFITPKMIESAKLALLKVFAGSDSEMEAINSFANLLGKNPFKKEELVEAKKRFLKALKDGVKTAEGMVEIINSQKKAKKQEPDFEKMIVPSFVSVFDDAEEFAIDWKEIFSSQDKKVMKEIALKTKLLEVYEAFVIIWQEGIDELDEIFGECDCDCADCKGCH